MQKTRLKARFFMRLHLCDTVIFLLLLTVFPAKKRYACYNISRG